MEGSQTRSSFCDIWTIDRHVTLRHEAGNQHVDRLRLEGAEENSAHECTDAWPLRVILSRYLKEQPDLVRFRWDSRGRPDLQSIGQREDIHFNISHSDNVSAVAVSDRRVGVDIEEVRSQRGLDAVASLITTCREARLLSALKDQAWLEHFFRLWCCKEAITKAIGIGLTCDLRRFDTTQSVRTTGKAFDVYDNESRSSWSLTSFDLIPGIVSAVALAPSVLGATGIRFLALSASHPNDRMKAFAITPPGRCKWHGHIRE